MLKAEHTIDLRGKRFVTYAGLLDLATEQGLVSIETELVQVPTVDNAHMAIVRATARFATAGGAVARVFTDYGDANPGNVGTTIRPHVLRMASTRAKARVLRDATNIGMTALEELGDLQADGDEPGPSGGYRPPPNPSRGDPMTQASEARAEAERRVESAQRHTHTQAMTTILGKDQEKAPLGPVLATALQIKAIGAAARHKGLKLSQLLDIVKRRYNRDAVETLTIDEANQITLDLERM